MLDRLTGAPPRARIHGRAGADRRAARRRPRRPQRRTRAARRAGRRQDDVARSGARARRRHVRAGGARGRVRGRAALRGAAPTAAPSPAPGRCTARDPGAGAARRARPRGRDGKPPVRRVGRGARPARGRGRPCAGHLPPRRCVSAWARPVAAHCRALVAGPDEAERLFREGLALHASSSRPFERAHTELAFGEFLRNARRRKEARGHLRTALEALEALGAQLWVERGRVELRASGQTARCRKVDITSRIQLAQLDLDLDRVP